MEVWRQLIFTSRLHQLHCAQFAASVCLTLTTISLGHLSRKNKHDKPLTTDVYFSARRAPLLAVCAVAVASYNTNAAVIGADFSLSPNMTEAELRERMIDECLEVAAQTARLRHMLLQTRFVEAVQDGSDSGSAGSSASGSASGDSISSIGRSDMSVGDDSSGTVNSAGKHEAVESVGSHINVPLPRGDHCGQPVFAVFQQERRAADIRVDAAAASRLALALACWSF